MTPLQKAAQTMLVNARENLQVDFLPERSAIMDHYLQDFFEASLRAALEALMEPSEEMYVPFNIADDVAKANARNIWQAMLRKVLEP